MSEEGLEEEDDANIARECAERGGDGGFRQQ